MLREAYLEGEMEALGQAAREIPAGTAMGAYLQEIRASGAAGREKGGGAHQVWLAVWGQDGIRCARLGGGGISAVGRLPAVLVVAWLCAPALLSCWWAGFSQLFGRHFVPRVFPALHASATA